MKKYFILWLTVLSLSPTLLADGKVSTFHRLVVFNASGELLVVRIKDTEFWVTPGFYQDEHTLIREGLKDLAETYGLTLSPISLRGVFTLKNPARETLSTRMVYGAQLKGGSLVKPDTIDEVRWLPVEKATKLITFPHINAMIQQIARYPDTVWGGSLERSKEGEDYRVKLLEEFYPLVKLKTQH